MTSTIPDDAKVATPNGVQDAQRAKPDMTAFVESCVETTADSAVAIARRWRHRSRAHRLLRLLKEKNRILVTTHQQPDPDALASSFALSHLLKLKLPDAQVCVSVKGSIGAGYNAAFIQQAEAKPLDMKLVEWDEAQLPTYDAIVLLDVQPGFKLSPLPPEITPTAVIDHHRSRGRRPAYPFSDIRPDVGASSSIIFSYFMEMDVDISRELAAMLLFAIETDLAGAAGQPGELDNMALSSLTLVGDPRKLYKMRYAPLPRSIYVAYAAALLNATAYDAALITHLDEIETPEAPAVIADFLLRYDQADWVLVTAIIGQTMVLSLRTASSKKSAADVMRRLVRKLGEGGGHRTKAGGGIALENGTPAEIERVRSTLRRRLLRAVGIRMSRGTKLVTARSI